VTRSVINPITLTQKEKAIHENSKVNRLIIAHFNVIEDSKFSTVHILVPANHADPKTGINNSILQKNNSALNLDSAIDVICAKGRYDIGIRRNGGLCCFS